MEPYPRTTYLMVGDGMSSMFDFLTKEKCWNCKKFKDQVLSNGLCVDCDLKIHNQDRYCPVCKKTTMFRIGRKIVDIMSCSSCGVLKDERFQDE